MTEEVPRRIMQHSGNGEDGRTRWDADRLKREFRRSADITVRELKSNRSFEVSIAYCNGMIDNSLLTEVAMPALYDVLESDAADDCGVIAAGLTARLQLQRTESDDDWTLRMFSGELIFFIGTDMPPLSLCIEQLPKRQPEESATEISLKGPRDGFTEEIMTNVALLRKRLRTPDLQNEQFIVGEQSRTIVSLIYLRGAANERIIDEARKRITEFKPNALFSSSQLEEAIADSPMSLFPLIDYIGRPDFAAQCLIRGRFIILVNGSPMGIIAPSTLSEQLKSPEDLHFPYYFVTFERMLRFFGLFVAIFLPGFWISLSAYNMEQLPFQLLATITSARLGLPLSAPMEAVLMLGMFELFREAGIRLPKAVGQTIAVVGGLIVGDASIRAGLTSPTMLVTSAVTAVATFTLVNQSLSGTVSVLRLFVLVCSAVLGMFGFFVSMFFIVVYTASLESFGIGYLEPLSPVKFRDLAKALLDVPKKWRRARPGTFK